jgi:hypothetical protein
MGIAPSMGRRDDESTDSLEERGRFSFIREVEECQAIGCFPILQVGPRLGMTVSRPLFSSWGRPLENLREGLLEILGDDRPGVDAEPRGEFEAALPNGESIVSAIAVRVIA